MKIVIAGSAKLQNEIKKWIDYWTNNGNNIILDFPREIPLDKFNDLYPEIHKQFFQNITNTDILFIANGIKNNINGYIGAETFAELSFGLAQKIVYNKDIKLILACMPDKKVACYEEIILWLELGWIDDILEKSI